MKIPPELIDPDTGLLNIGKYDHERLEAIFAKLEVCKQ